MTPRKARERIAGEGQKRAPKLWLHIDNGQNPYYVMEGRVVLGRFRTHALARAALNVVRDIRAERPTPGDQNAG